MEKRTCYLNVKTTAAHKKLLNSVRFAGLFDTKSAAVEAAIEALAARYELTLTEVTNG